MKLWHWYHIYADGQWTEPVAEHMAALQSSGLLDELSGIYLGVVGTDENRAAAVQAVKDVAPDAQVEVEAPFAWEQISLSRLRRIANRTEGYYLYAHTKSAFNTTPLNINWRKSMEFYNVIKWRDAIGFLADVSTVGCHWCQDKFWGGNYWWAKSSYLRGLPEPKMINRWNAEEWIGTNEPTIHDMNPGWPDEKLFVTSW